MSGEIIDVDINSLSKHASEHRSIAGQWDQWPQGADGVVSDVIATHGVVASPVAAALARYNQARQKFATSQHGKHTKLADVLDVNQADYRSTDDEEARRATAAVRHLA